jgi:hypothetical protein
MPSSAPDVSTEIDVGERHGDRYHLRELTREAQGRVEVDRERQARADDERRDRVLVERRRSCSSCP